MSQLTEAGPIIHLRSGGTSLVVLADDGRLPRIIHWGEDLGDLSASVVESLVRAGLPAVGDSPVTYPQPVPVLPQLVEGWMGRPGLTGDSDGTRWAAKFGQATYQLEERERAQAIVCSATDPEFGLRIVIEIELCSSGLVRQRATLTNDLDETFNVNGLELVFPVPNRATELLDFSGRWALERYPQRKEFQAGAWVRESRGGKPGLEHALLMAAGEPGFGFRSGDVWAVHLGWSGNHVLAAEHITNGVRHLSAGEIILPSEVVLARDESYTSPWLYGSWGRGLDDLSARFHREIRSWAQRPKQPRPVILNTWEAVYFDHDFDVLAEYARRGAELGIERFVVDDGWFLGRRNDHTSLGDWEVDRTVWPDGLEPLANLVRELGMEFGLWFEPEMINLESDLARAHPEWVFDAGHGPGLPSRYQHVLDLGHEGAYAHVRDLMFKAVRDLDIAYIKWDHNRYLLDAGHSSTGKAGVRNQTLAAYRLMAELKAEFPNLEIESCASGGGRIDLGVLEYTDRVWSSDCNDPHERLEIQRWTGLLVPPEYQGTHIGAEQSHTTGRVAALDYRAEKALWGNLGLEVNILESSDETNKLLEQWISYHRANRDLLHSGQVVNADLPDEAFRLQGVVAQDCSQGLYAFSVVERPRTWPAGRISLPGLDPVRDYKVTVEFPGRPAPDGPRPPWTTTETVLPGRILETIGIEAPALNPDSSVLIRAVAV